MGWKQVRTWLPIYDYAEGIPDSGFNVLKMYYNMSAPKGVPYVKDRYSIMHGDDEYSNPDE